MRIMRLIAIVILATYACGCTTKTESTTTTAPEKAPAKKEGSKSGISKKIGGAPKTEAADEQPRQY